jgi:hypothetical protein
MTTLIGLVVTTIFLFSLGMLIVSLWLMARVLAQKLFSLLFKEGNRCSISSYGRMWRQRGKTSTK